MSEEEKRLLEMFRACDERGKETVLFVAEGESRRGNTAESADFAP